VGKNNSIGGPMMVKNALDASIHENYQTFMETVKDNTARHEPLLSGSKQHTSSALRP
jgi:hypothetical protein